MVNGAESAADRPWWLFCVLLALLAVKCDGRSPLPAAIGEPVFQLYLLATTVVFGAGLLGVLRFRQAGERDGGAVGTGRRGRGDLRRRDRGLRGARPRAAPVRLAAVATAAFLTADGVVLWLEARHYAAFGYLWRPAAAILICAAPAAAGGWLAMRRDPLRPAALLAIATGAHAALCFYACACFPLAAGRSDMLPLLMAAARALLAGHEPYAVYHLTPGAGVPLTYLPGLLLAYLPAAALGLDPRLWGLAWTLAATGLIYRRAAGGGGGPGDGGAAAAAWLAPFLVNPYLIYRHEAYLPPFWLLLAVAWAVVARPRPRPGAVAAVCGALALTSQLLAVPACALAIFGLRRFGAGAMLRRLLPVAAACIAVLLLAALPDPTAFAVGVAGHWQGALQVETLGATWWLLHILPAACVHVLQAGAVFAVLLLSPAPGRRRPASAAAQPWSDRAAAEIAAGQPQSGLAPADITGGRPRSDLAAADIAAGQAHSVLAAASLALFAFAALNTVTWTYFYLPVLFLAMLARLPYSGAPAGPRAEVQGATPGER